MYAWGGSISGWRGKGSYDYGSARARYDKAAKGMPSKRVYSRKSEPDMDLVNPKGKTIKSESENPIVIAVDVTGSMAEWPGEIFDRLPLLYQTLSKYREDAEFAFAAIGDATCDRYPLQINDFSKDPSELEKMLKALGCEGGGGGQTTESYELFGYFMSNHVETPNAKSPFLLMYGDEQFYPEVDPRQVKHYIGDSLQDPIKSQDVLDGLLNKFNFYHLHKPYGYGGGDDKRIVDAWGKALGRQRVVKLPSMERAVDVGMGLIAKHWGEYDDFSTSLDARHDSTSVKKGVHHSLRFISTAPSGMSVMPNTSKKSKVTKSLMDSS